MLERVMLSYINITTGHRKAAQSIHKTLNLIYPEIDVLEIDPLGYFHPKLENIIGKIYFEIIKTNPDFWDFIYDNEQIVKLTAKIRQALNSLNSTRLHKLFSSFNPQVVICTHALPCGIFSALKKKLDDFSLIGVITDFDIHNYWIHENVSYYVVSNDETAKKLEEKRINKERIKILGIPIDPVFTEDKDIYNLKKKYELKDDLPTILIMGGGLGLGPIDKIVHCLNKIKNIDFQVIVVAGTNKELELKLREISATLPKLTKVFGYVNFIDELMKISNILIGKPGGLTTAESLACGLPMLIVNPIPGQEERNTQYLISQGVAIKVSNEFEIQKTIQELLITPENLLKMRQKTSNISKPKSAFDIIKVAQDSILT
ncbi:MAG: glycosyltransferase [bacterium]